VPGYYMNAAITERILVIDDDPTANRLCKRVLDREGFVVEIATDGTQGLEMLGTASFDVVLLDVNLPDRSGLDVLSTIQQINPEMAVIVITGYGTIENAVTALKSGAQDFMLKPFGPDELLASVQRVLEKGRLRRENLRLTTLLPILEISKELISEMDPTRLAQRVLETVQHELGADQAALMLLDEDNQLLSTLATLGLDAEDMANLQHRARQRLCETAVREKSPLLASRWDESGAMQRDSGYVVCVPLVLQDRVLGVLSASRPPDLPPFRQDDVGLLSILCDQVAVVLENGRLFEQTRQDYAERMRAQEALSTSTEKVRAMFESVTAGITFIDSQGKIVEANGAFAELIGYESREALVGQSVLRLVIKGDRDRARETLQTILETGHAQQAEFRVSTRDGRTLDVETSATMLRDEQGNTTGLVAITSDITERKRAEEMLRQHTERLEILHEIEQGILTARSPAEIAQATADRIRRLVPCRRVGILLLDLQSQEAIVLAADSESEPCRAQGSRTPLDDFVPIWSNLGALSDGKVVVYSVPERENETTTVPLGRIRTLYSVPLLVQDKLIGALNLGMADPDEFVPGWQDIIRQIANELAIAIQQARLSEAEVQRRQEAEALRDTAAALNGTLDLEEVLDRILDNVGRVVPHGAANIMLVEDGIARIVRHRGYVDSKALTRRFDVALMPALSEMAASLLPLAVPNTDDYPDWITFPATTPVYSYAGAPICSQGKLVGFLNLNSSTLDFFQPLQAKRLQVFADQAAVAIENARLHERLQGYIEQLEQRVMDRTQDLSTLYEVTTIASESLELGTTLERTLDRVIAAIRGSAGVVYLWDEIKGTLCLTTQRNISPDMMPLISSAPVHDALAGWVFHHNEPIIIADLMTDPRAPPTLCSTRFRAYAGVPMRIEGRTIGVLGALSEVEQEFNIEDVALLASIADHLATAVENDRLRQRAERAAVLEERERLARELHDSVTQSLYSLTLLAEAGREQTQAGALEQAARYQLRVSEIAQHALKEMRLLVHELRPPLLEKEGLVGALRQRLEAVEGRAGVKTRLLVDELANLPAAVEEGLYRIALEALNNALKHAAASSVNVCVRTQDGRIELEVTDDGIGFDPDVMDDRGGMGLSSMRERAEKLGAALTIQSAPGKGTQVLIRIAEV
jgi:PAS domain S-box-containing protein